MVRITKEYDERYAEFLDVAQKFFYSKGYEQTSVQEIINKVGVAKGTFYHYFASKTDLLDALIERIIGQILTLLEPLVTDESLNAKQKFEQFFARVNNWKTANRDFLLEIMRVLYQDENVLLRTKLRARSRAMTLPLLTEIIRQGVDEEAFDVANPDHAAEIVFVMGQACSDATAEQLLKESQDEVAVSEIKAMLIAYERSIERVLHASEGSLRLITPEYVGRVVSRKSVEAY